MVEWLGRSLSSPIESELQPLAKTWTALAKPQQLTKESLLCPCSNFPLKRFLESSRYFLSQRVLIVWDHALEGIQCYSYWKQYGNFTLSQNIMICQCGLQWSFTNLAFYSMLWRLQFTPFNVIWNCYFFTYKTS